MYYHASTMGDIQTLKPHISNHGSAKIYFSTKRENVLVYLCNAIRKHWLEQGLEPKEHYQTWGSYGFSDGILRVEEYYPNATEDVYKGAAGWIYSVKEVDGEDLPSIPFVVTTEKPVKVADVEYIPDAYDAIMEAVKEGKILLQRYEENSPKKLEWIEWTIQKEYEEASAGGQEDYCLFLEAKFGNILK